MKISKKRRAGCVGGKPGWMASPGSAWPCEASAERGWSLGKEAYSLGTLPWRPTPHPPLLLAMSSHVGELTYGSELHHHASHLEGPERTIPSWKNSPKLGSNGREFRNFQNISSLQSTGKVLHPLVSSMTQ